MAAQPQTVVVIPTYNERANVVTVCDALLGEEPGLAVIIVDDNSPDGTGDVADALARDEPRLRVIHRPAKNGLGPAYVDGLSLGLALGHTTLITMDADMSHDPRDVARLVEPISAGRADVAIGSRWTAGGGTMRWPLSRRILSRGGSLYARTVLGMHIRDATGGFKCFSSAVLRAIGLRTMRSSGYAFNIELTYRALRLDYRVEEVPILFTERVVGDSKMSLGIMAEALIRVPSLRLQAHLWSAPAVATSAAGGVTSDGIASKHVA